MKLHIHHASTQWRDADVLTAEDMRVALRRKAHVVTMSEIFRGNERDLRRIAQEEGYLLANAAGNDAICVRKGLRTRVLDTGSRLVNPGVPGKPPNVGHSARHALWATVKIRREVFTVITAHWVTGALANEERRAEWVAMSEAVTAITRDKGRGRRLAFVTGDTNLDDEPSKNAAREHLWGTFGLTTCWDELRVWPQTHGGPRGATIDMIASYDKDARVKCEAARAWPKQNSDHLPISAWYNVRR